MKYHLKKTTVYGQTKVFPLGFDIIKGKPIEKYFFTPRNWRGCHSIQNQKKTRENTWDSLKVWCVHHEKLFGADPVPCEALSRIGRTCHQDPTAVPGWRLFLRTRWSSIAHGDATFLCWPQGRTELSGGGVGNRPFMSPVSRLRKSAYCTLPPRPYNKHLHNKWYNKYGYSINIYIYIKQTLSKGHVNVACFRAPENR